MVKRIAIVCSVLLAIGSAANGWDWVDYNVGGWSDPSNWVGGFVPDYPTTGHIYVDYGTVNLDCDASVGRMELVRGDPNLGTGPEMTMTLNIHEDYTLISKQASAGEIFKLGYDGTATLNQTAGTVIVRTDAGTGGRLVISRNATATGQYNLGGSGMLDTETLRKASKDRFGGFTATGGTLIVRTEIAYFGKFSEGRGFNQGGCLLAPRGMSTVGAILVGHANTTDYDATGGIIELDIAGPGATQIDRISSKGSVNLGGATLQVNLLGGYTPTSCYWNIWQIVLDANSVATGTGSGNFGSLPTGYSTLWLDLLGEDSVPDTLRLYVPEPATLALLMLGGSALVIRRRR